MRKYYKRKAPRRTYRRRYRRSRPATRQPWKLTRTFRYVHLLDENLAAGGETLSRHFNITNPGGPIDETHQALGWLDAIDKYRWWRVKGVKVTLKNNNDDRQQLIDSIWHFFFTREQADYNFDDLTTHWENFGINNRKVLRVGTMDKKGESRTGYWSARKWYGPITIANQEYWGSGANEPLEAVHLNVHGMSAIENGDPGMAHLMIQIEYIVEFREPYLDRYRDADLPAFAAKTKVPLETTTDVLLDEIEQGGLQEEIQ